MTEERLKEIELDNKSFDGPFCDECTELIGEIRQLQNSSRCKEVHFLRDALLFISQRARTRGYPTPAEWAEIIERVHFTVGDVLRA